MVGFTLVLWCRKTAFLPRLVGCVGRCKNPAVIIMWAVGSRGWGYGRSYQCNPQVSVFTGKTKKSCARVLVWRGAVLKTSQQSYAWPQHTLSVCLQVCLSVCLCRTEGPDRHTDIQTGKLTQRTDRQTNTDWQTNIPTDRHTN